MNLEINNARINCAHDDPATWLKMIDNIYKSNDKRALEQDYSYSFRQKALDTSDWGMNIFIFMSVLLALDKNIRKDWYDVLLHQLNFRMRFLNQ